MGRVFETSIFYLGGFGREVGVKVFRELGVRGGRVRYKRLRKEELIVQVSFFLLDMYFERVVMSQG